MWADAQPRENPCARETAPAGRPALTHQVNSGRNARRLVSPAVGRSLSDVLQRLAEPLTQTACQLAVQPLATSVRCACLSNRLEGQIIAYKPYLQAMAG